MIDSDEHVDNDTHSEALVMLHAYASHAKMDPVALREATTLTYRRFHLRKEREMREKTDVRSSAFTSPDSRNTVDYPTVGSFGNGPHIAAGVYHEPKAPRTPERRIAPVESPEASP